MRRGVRETAFCMVCNSHPSEGIIAWRYRNGQFSNPLFKRVSISLNCTTDLNVLKIIL